MDKSEYDPMDLTTFPHLSLIIPYSPEMSKPKGLNKCLTSALEIAEKQLQKKYPPEQSKRLIQKLRDVIHKVKCTKKEKNLAIFISLIAQKVYYYTPSAGENTYMPRIDV